MRASRVVGLGALAALVVVSIASAHVHAPHGIGGDSYRNADSMHATNVEPDSFSYGNTIVTVMQTGRFFNGGASNIAWATSTDGGRTWRKGNLPSTTVNSTPPGPWARISDPAVAYDPEHDVWMISSLGIDASATGRAVLTSRSTDGGLTWGPPVTVAQTASGFYDKNWIACDTWPQSPHYGNCYTQWDNAFGNVILMSTSTDGGLIWGAPQAPPVTPGLGGQPVVQPNGTVVVPYTATYSSIRAFRSTDGGATWSSAVLVAPQQRHSLAGNLREHPLPSAEVDSAGRVFVVWHDCQFRSGCGANDIVMSTSMDGVTWTPKIPIPIPNPSGLQDNFLPGIGVDPVGPPGRVGVIYYYYPVATTPDLHAGFTSSGDSGATWHTPITLAGPMQTNWAPLTSQGYMVGDYFSTSFVNHEAHPVFARGTAPRPPNNQLNMLTWEAGIAVPAGRGPLRTTRASVKPVYVPMWLARERATAPPPTAN
jgi:BNR repeat-like domain